jgi:drug/metabolite transporter (DMT)-like permease
MLTATSRPSTSVEWFWLVQMGLMQSGAAHLFWNYGLVYIKANTASILFMLTILFSTVNEVIFLGLELHRYIIIGALLICISGYFLTMSLRSKVKT